MAILSGSNLSKVFGADEIFSDISVEINHKDRIALVGPNGAGKTTLVSLLLGLDLPTEGVVTTARDARVAYLPQRPEMAGNHSLWQEQLRAFAGLREMEARLAQLAEAMAEADTHDKALAEYGPLQQEFDHRGGYTYETRIRMVLDGVGFAPGDYHMPLTQLSGGQKTRAMLSRLLLEEPDLLILDEPTNHLDINAVEWLESFLKDFSGAVLAVSHDRYFINNFANNVWELEFGILEGYRGNYTQYLNQREERRERLQKEFEAQQEFIAKEQDYIRKHMGSRWTAQAKGRLKKLETMKRRGKIIDRGPRERQRMRLAMVAGNRSGDKVLMTQNLSVGYQDDGKVLFQSPDITLYRGETAAIIGPNGAGKSTLLKTLIGQLAPLSGSSTLGAQVQIGYFAQAHELLNPRNTILDELYSVRPMPQNEARSYLGSFLFSGDDVFRPIDTLSGGERGRVALAKLALGGSNLLLLDEPTNHLDIDSQEILQSVLDQFNGTVLLVSHDRYLINALATQIWQVSDGGLEVFEGSFEEFVAARNQKRLQEQTSSSNGNGSSRRAPAQYAEKKHGLSPYQLERRLAELEAHVHKLEDKLEQISRDLETASSAGDTGRVLTLGEQYNQTEADLDSTMEEWARLAE